MDETNKNPNHVSLFALPSIEAIKPGKDLNDLVDALFCDGLFKPGTLAEAVETFHLLLYIYRMAAENQVRLHFEEQASLYRMIRLSREWLQELHKEEKGIILTREEIGRAVADIFM